MVVTTKTPNVEVVPGAVLAHQYLVLPMVSRQVAVREKHAWPITARENVLASLKASEEDVFPIRYQLKSLVSGETRARDGQVE